MYWLFSNFFERFFWGLITTYWVFRTQLKIEQDTLCPCESESEVVSDSATPWTVAYQAPLSMGLSRQEYWSGLPFPSPGDLPKPGIEPRSPTLQADTLNSEPPG